MPRDQNGNVVPPSGTIVNSGDTVLPSQHNPIVTDYAAMIEQSLSRDGQGGMRTHLNMNGFKIINVGWATLNSDAVSLGQIGSMATPIGTLVDYAGDTPPNDWMLCYGQELSRNAYPALFSVIGIKFGTSSPSTFNLPDFRGRVAAGRDNMGGVSADRLSGIIASTTVGSVGGNKQHTLTVAEIAKHGHTITQEPHTHDLTDPGHTHKAIASSSGSVGLTASNMADPAQGGRDTTSSKTGITIASANANITIAETGGGSPHPNVQPTIIMNKIIKVR